MPIHTCTERPCPTCKVDRWNAAEWNLEAAENQHRHRSDEARLDWIENNYEPDEP